MDDILNHSKGQGAFLKQLQGLSLAKLLLMTDSLIEDHYSASIGRNYRERPMTNPPTSLGEAIRLYQGMNSADKYIAAKSPTSLSEAIKIQDNLNMAKEAFVRIAQRAHLNMLDSDEGQRILFQAFSYNIPFNSITVNFIELRNEIEEYEELLDEADLHQIEWDRKEYDPMGLRQEIEEFHRESRVEKNEAYREYLDSRVICADY